jgi:transposase
VARTELTDDEWESIEPLRFRTGSQWREVPCGFGAWQTVYNRFVQWRDAGVFEALLDGMVTLGRT